MVPPAPRRDNAPTRLLLLLALISVVPPLLTWLPNLVMGGGYRRCPGRPEARPHGKPVTARAG